MLPGHSQTYWASTHETNLGVILLLTTPSRRLACFHCSAYYTTATGNTTASHQSTAYERTHRLAHPEAQYVTPSMFIQKHKLWRNNFSHMICSEFWHGYWRSEADLLQAGRDLPARGCTAFNCVRDHHTTELLSPAEPTSPGLMLVVAIIMEWHGDDGKG